MSTEKVTLNKYRLKGEFQHLFENLASGEEYVANDAFKDHSVPKHKALTSLGEMKEFESHEALMEKLVAAEFVERHPVHLDIQVKG